MGGMAGGFIDRAVRPRNHSLHWYRASSSRATQETADRALSVRVARRPGAKRRIFKGRRLRWRQRRQSRSHHGDQWWWRRRYPRLVYCLVGHAAMDPTPSIMMSSTITTGAPEPKVLAVLSQSCIDGLQDVPAL